MTKDFNSGYHQSREGQILPVKMNSLVNSTGRTTLIFDTDQPRPLLNNTTGNNNNGLWFSNKFRSWINEFQCSSQMSVPLFGKHFYLVSCLTATLIFLILLNLVLFAWIVTSLRLHQVSQIFLIIFQIIIFFIYSE